MDSPNPQRSSGFGAFLDAIQPDEGSPKPRRTIEEIRAAAQEWFDELKRSNVAPSASIVAFSLIRDLADHLAEITGEMGKAIDSSSQSGEGSGQPSKGAMEWARRMVASHGATGIMFGSDLKDDPARVILDAATQDVRDCYLATIRNWLAIAFDAFARKMGEGKR